MKRTVVFYLTSFGTSLLGNSITAIALPLVVLFTTGSPLSAGVVAIAAAVPAALAGLLMGSLVDRINRRTAAVLSDVISAAALLVLPIVDLTIGLSLGWFLAVAVLNSFGDVPGLTAREAMLPAIARAAAMDSSRLIGLRESLAGVSLLLGPAIAGILVAAFAPVTVLWITSGLATTAALLTLLIPKSATVLAPDHTEASTTPPARSVFHGLGVIVRSPLLRGLVLLGMALAIVLAATQGMVIPVHFAFQDEPQFVGFVLSALAAGLLIGGGCFAVLGHRIPHRVWFTTGLVLVAMGFSIIGVLGPVWSIFAGAAIVGVGGGSMNAVIGLAFIENVDDSQRGTVLGAQNAIMTLVPAAGIGVAAVLIEVSGLHLATTALAALWILAAIGALLTPRLRRLGQHEA
ncbi:MFS transporter [Nocardiopsis sp. L17-MgMaSL7]|uniref:MFS transporter n=1 Tax=Nocardiopsis sp. L17-MgMaSL7 TaxID=1938893 RepID=UPI000D712E27|nr:MFS transporter [Nocardiopsis sp. L17-MgMaSL7]PWV54679.1 Na+/melibiose symporter-like transporter [Nocardiopsis sp. L17-MgMaSL7]